MTPTIEALKVVWEDAKSAGRDWAVVEDWLFDAYKAEVRTVERWGPPREPQKEHLMFKDIRVYPLRARYVGYDNETRCDRCGKTLELGEHPFCPHGFGSNARIHDDIPGGRVIENLGPHPVTVYSMTEYHRLRKAAGLEVKEKFCPTPGTDIDPAGIPNPKGYMDAYTLANGAELIMRNGRKTRDFDAVEDGVIRNQQSGHLTERDAIAVASGDKHRQARLGRRMRG